MDFSIFSKEKFPSERKITLGNSIEAKDVEAFFSGRSQSDITLDVLKTEYTHDPAACLSFMVPEAFCFFLPAYMRIALENYDLADAIPSAVIYDLLCIARGEFPDRLEAILSSYSSNQIKSIACYLKEMSDTYWSHYPYDNAKMALNDYWGQYLVT